MTNYSKYLLPVIPKEKDIFYVTLQITFKSHLW